MTSAEISRYVAPSAWEYERIEITATGPNAAIWSPPYDLFTLAHEYGHALHQGALGGIHKYGDCGSSHRLDQPINVGCAFSEGFADYHAVATMGGELGAYYSGVASNLFYPGGDGSIIEGPFASLLFDISDAAGDEAFDSIQLSGAYVASTIRDCRLTMGTGSSKVDGSDYMVYCLERQLDPATQNYFTQRSLGAISVSPGVTAPTGWTLAAIRALWRRDLFGQ